MNGMEKNNIQFAILKNPISKIELKQLILLYTAIFEDADIDFFKNRIQEKENLCIIVAKNKSKNYVGFKIGYRYNEETFYSWVGGVLPKYRQQKIAFTLAKMQEQWAKKNGFLKIRTKSMNQFKPMLILNLKNNFNIKSVYTNKLNQTKIVFEKEL
jgi:predicted GNAT superfamily acetyltransferase